MNPNLPYWLAGLYLKNIGPRTFFNWLNHVTDIKTLFTAGKQELLTTGFSEKHYQLLQDIDWQTIEKDLIWADEKHQHIICFDDKSYPQLLKQIADPPLILFVKG